GGDSSAGSVFEIATPNVISNLYSFTGGNDGNAPYAGLVLGTDGSFYGTTSSGGSKQVGNIFTMDHAVQVVSLYDFTGLDDGASLRAALVQGRDGNFYSTTYEGGSAGFGTIFS